MPKTYRKPHRIKKKKSILRNRFFWLGILIVLSIEAGFYFLFFSETFQVKKIIVTGEEKIFEEDLKSIVEKNIESKILLFQTKSIFWVNSSRIRKDILDKFPQIAKVEISWGLPDALNILVVERLGLAVWCQGNSCFLLDNEGVIFERVQVLEETELIKITEKQNIDSLVLGNNVIKKEKLDKILEIERKLKTDFKILPREILLLPDSRVNMETLEGWEIYFDLGEDLDWQITKLKLVLENEIPPQKREGLEYIDLRFEKVYFK